MQNASDAGILPCGLELARKSLEGCVHVWRSCFCGHAMKAVFICVSSMCVRGGRVQVYNVKTEDKPTLEKITKITRNRGVLFETDLRQKSRSEMNKQMELEFFFSPT